ALMELSGFKWECLFVIQMWKLLEMEHGDGDIWRLNFWFWEKVMRDWFEMIDWEGEWNGLERCLRDFDSVVW
uniref:hypothetical protein n=1 Tax=Bacillus sp. WP8 TaxID=756828 RepID=UPI001C93090A